MRVKRFKNLWAMGLILCGVMLVAFYVAKLFFPEFIVGVAELPSIVKFGEFVDSHLWAYYPFDIIVAFLFSYIYCCACSRKPSLTRTGTFVVFIVVLLLELISIFIPKSFVSFNFAIFAFTPFLVCYIENNVTPYTFVATSICLFVDIIAQEMSSYIRDVGTMTIHLNSATFLVLLIDTLIWRILLYCFFNFKKGENNNG